MNDVHISCKIMIMPEVEYSPYYCWKYLPCPDLYPDLTASCTGSMETIIQRNIG